MCAAPVVAGKRVGGRSGYAYLFHWHGYYAPRALHRLQKAGVRTKVLTSPIQAVVADVTAASFDWHGYAGQPEEPEHSLIWEAARGVADEWHAHSDDKFLTETGAVYPTRGATHIAFCDVGTPKAGRTDTVYDWLRDHLVVYATAGAINVQ